MGIGNAVNTQLEMQLLAYDVLNNSIQIESRCKIKIESRLQHYLMHLARDKTDCNWKTNEKIVFRWKYDATM